MTFNSGSVLSRETLNHITFLSLNTENRKYKERDVIIIDPLMCGRYISIMLPQTALNTAIVDATP